MHVQGHKRCKGVTGNKSYASRTARFKVVSCRVYSIVCAPPNRMRNDFEPRSIGMVLQELIADLGIGPKLEEAKALETWASLAGERINKHTRRTWIKGGRLYVSVSSSVWRHELHLQRSQWLRRLNKALDSDVVTEIIFR